MTIFGASGRLLAVLFDRDDTLADADPGEYREAAPWTRERFGVDPQVAGHGLAASWWDLRTPDEEEAFWARSGERLGTRLGMRAAPIDLSGRVPGALHRLRDGLALVDGLVPA